MDMKTPLDIHSVTKSFGKHKVLDEVSFTLKEGEIFGLIGLNGVGKTTLIKVILHLLQADSGKVSIFGQDSASVEARRNLLYLPEKFQPSRHLKGREFLQFALSYYGRKYPVQKAQEMAEKLDLRPEMLEHKVGAYSKGMGQKLGLLSAFLVNVPLLILDEPMSGLDPSARIKLKALLLEARQQGVTVFFSSHILSDIEEICDRVGVIHASKLQYLGTPQGFKEQFQSDNLEKAFLHAIGEAQAA